MTANACGPLVADGQTIMSGVVFLIISEMPVSTDPDGGIIAIDEKTQTLPAPSVITSTLPSGDPVYLTNLQGIS